MKLSKITLLFLILILNIHSSFASCNNLLRHIVNDRMGNVTNNLYGHETEQMYKKKSSVLKSAAALLGPKSLVYSKKMGLQDISFRRVLTEGLLRDDYTRALTVMREAMHDYQLMEEWARNLHQDIAVEVYTEGTHSDKAYYYLSQKIPKRTVLLVLLERLENIGFTYGAHEINKELKMEEFAQILIKKKLILDSYFGKSTHGDLIHLLQLDLVSYALMKERINPKILVELYEWMGKGIEIPLENSPEPFNSLEDAWYSLFDSFEADLTSPDIFNPILTAYFNWVSI